MDEVVSANNKKAKGSRQPKLPEMTVTDMEKSTMAAMQGHNKGMSLDMMSTPYLLPAAVNGSRESFHSMSRSLRDEEDPYRPVTMARTDTRTSSLRSPTTHAPRYDNESIYTGSSIPSGDAMNAGLLRNAQRMSQSNPFEDVSSPESERGPQFEHHLSPVTKRQSVALPAVEITQPAQSYQPYQPDPYHPTVPAVNVDIVDDEDDEPFHVTPPSPPAHQQSHPAAAAASLSIAIPPPVIHEPEFDEEPAVDSNRLSTVNNNNRLSTAQGDGRRVSVMGLRPLPPDDPADNPEQRANRIRSFYKEYFDDSKPNPTGFYPQYNPYQDDYEPEFYEDGAFYDPETGEFVGTQAPAPPRAPFAQPGMGRRAMTPEPAGAIGRRMRSNTASLQSTGHIDNPAFRGPRGPPKKPLPPPSTLKSLPTPAKLQGDDIVFLNPTDFAPKPTYRDQQLGRVPDSPLGVERPYSPAVRAHTPLMKSFDDLAALPSP